MCNKILTKNIFLKISLLILSNLNLNACEARKEPTPLVIRRARSASFYEPGPVAASAPICDPGGMFASEDEFEFGGEFRADSASSAVSADAASTGASADVAVRPGYSLKDLLSRDTEKIAEILNLREQLAESQRELEIERAAKARLAKDARRLAGLQANNKELALDRERLLRENKSLSEEHASDRLMLTELKEQFVKVLETAAGTRADVRSDMRDASTNTEEISEVFTTVAATVARPSAASGLRPAVIVVRPGAARPRSAVDVLRFRFSKATIGGAEISAASGAASSAGAHK